MGRRAKHKQGAPPTFEEMQAAKQKRQIKRSGKSEISSGPKHKKVKQTQPDDETEFPEDVPQVDLEQLAKEKKTLFEDSSDEEHLDDLDDEVDIDEYDSEEEERAKPMFSDDEDDGEMERINVDNMEKYSKMLDEEAEAEAEEAEEELVDAQQANPRPKVLGDETGEEEEEGSHDLTFIRTRMLEIVKVLENFKDLAEEGRDRTEYIDRLIKDISEYYGYTPYLAEKLFNLFSPSEAIEFFEANEVHRPITIRTNTLRTRRRDLAQALVNRGVNLQPIGSWTKVGLQIFDSQVPIGATPEYLAGHYILQAASSFLPVIAMDPQPGERVLDMASAPGGKSTYIAAMMKGTGIVVANDSDRSRTKSLVANVHRLGCSNVIVCNYDAREFPKVLGGFDRVLLDAPCTGTGIIAKNQTVKTAKTPKEFIQIPELQKQLLLSAIDSVDANSKNGGVIVYSTCSVAVEEDEAVVSYALRKRPNVKLVETGLEIGKKGFVSYRGRQFDRSLSMTRRYFPHTYNVDGFYVAKFQKLSGSPHDTSKDGAAEKEAAIRADYEKEGLIHDDFGELENAEDNTLIEDSIKRGLRRRGIDPKSVEQKKN